MGIFTLSNFSKALFSTRSPRHFQHHSVYTSDKYQSKKQLEERIRKVKIEQGELPPDDYNPEERIRGTFIEGTTHLQRRKEKDAGNPNSNKKRFTWPIIFLVLAIIIFYYLLK